VDCSQNILITRKITMI